MTRYKYSGLWNVKNSLTTKGDCVRFIKIMRSARTFVIWFLAIMSAFLRILIAKMSPVVRFLARNTEPYAPLLIGLSSSKSRIDVAVARVCAGGRTCGELGTKLPTLVPKRGLLLSFDVET